MNRIPEIAPISDMRVRQMDIVQKAQRGPVVLVERGSKPALVVVSPDLWNALTERIEFLEDAVAVYRKKWEVATGQDEMIELSPAEIEDWLEDALPAQDYQGRAATGRSPARW